MSNLLQNHAEIASFLSTTKQRPSTIIAIQDNVRAQEYANSLKFTYNEIDPDAIKIFKLQL